MKMKFEYILLAILTVIMVVFSIGIFDNAEESMEISSDAYNITLSNEKIEWGIKRNDNHLQPDLGSKNKSLIDKYNGIAMGNAEDKYVYLTFDNGYEAGYTEKILDVLKENNVSATFFITGHYVNTASEIIQRMIDEGHCLGNHTVNHYSMPGKDDETLKKEIMNLHTTVYEKFNYEMSYIRPPKGEYSERTLNLSNNLGYTTVMWSFAYDDWEENKQGREQYGIDKILKNVHPGEVILLHATSKDNANILDYCIKEIKNLGYEFKKLDEFK